MIVYSIFKAQKIMINFSLIIEMNQFSLKLNNLNPSDYVFSLQDTNNFFYKRFEHFIVVRFYES